MKLALLSEIGARSVTDHLAHRVDDEELRSMMLRLNQEGVEVIDRLRGLMIEIGGRPRETSLRRRALARLLVLLSRVIGVRFVLRVCMNACETVARWYGQYQVFFTQLGEDERAALCGELAETKRRHALALGAWVSNLAR